MLQVINPSVNSFICHCNIIVDYNDIMVRQMCDCAHSSNPLPKYIRALHCPTRWTIIRFIGNGKKSTKEIQRFLKQKGENITRSGLYFHLSELKKAGIIDVAGYKEDGGGAPEKIWKVKKKKIAIDLFTSSKGEERK